MNSFKRLQEKMIEVEKECEHNGYYYKVSDALTIMICGTLCNLQNISDIYEWAKSEPAKQFLLEEFNMHKIPSRAQFYNLIGCVNPRKFNILFIEWVEEIIKNDNKDRTIAIDGKTICQQTNVVKTDSPCIF